MATVGTDWSDIMDQGYRSIKRYLYLYSQMWPYGMLSAPFKFIDLLYLLDINAIKNLSCLV